MPCLTRLFAALTLTAICAVASVAAQGVEVVGMVRDQTGDTLPGVLVELTTAAAPVRLVQTDARGGYRFDGVAAELDRVDSILIVGPASAKHEFVKFVHEHHRSLASKIVGVETADHPTGKEIVAHARRYFKASDRMKS